MICTCAQCNASDYNEPQEDWSASPMAAHEITALEQGRERMITALRELDVNLGRPKWFSDALTEYKRRQGLSLADWLEENKRHA